MNTPNITAAIIMLVTLNVKPEFRETFKNILIADSRGAKTEKGNITTELYESEDNQNVFYLFERWTDQSALDEHFTTHYATGVFQMNKTALSSPMEIVYLFDIAPVFNDQPKKALANDQAVDLIVTFPVKDGLQEKFLNGMQKSIKLSRAEDGNIAYDVHAVHGETTKFIIHERWKNQESLNIHFKKTTTAELLEVFKETLSQPVESIMNFVTEVSL